MSQPIVLDCNACRSERSMSATTVPKFGTIVRLIGRILLIPSFIGFAAAVLMLVASGQVSRSDPSDAALNTGIGFALFLFIAIPSLVGGLLGWLLLMQRKVYKCERCGFVLDRA